MFFFVSLMLEFFWWEFFFFRNERREEGKSGANMEKGWGREIIRDRGEGKSGATMQTLSMSLPCLCIFVAAGAMEYGWGSHIGRVDGVDGIIRDRFGRRSARGVGGGGAHAGERVFKQSVWCFARHSRPSFDALVATRSTQFCGSAILVSWCVRGDPTTGTRVRRML